MTDSSLKTWNYSLSDIFCFFIFFATFADKIIWNYSERSIILKFLQTSTKKAFLNGTWQASWYENSFRYFRIKKVEERERTFIYDATSPNFASLSWERREGSSLLTIVFPPKTLEGMNCFKTWKKTYRPLHTSTCDNLIWMEAFAIFSANERVIHSFFDINYLAKKCSQNICPWTVFVPKIIWKGKFDNIIEKTLKLDATE